MSRLSGLEGAVQGVRKELLDEDTLGSLSEFYYQHKGRWPRGRRKA